MTPSAFPLLPNYIPSNVYSYWVTCIDIWTLWNTRSRLQVLTHIDMYCLPNRPGRPRPHWAESCLTEASQRISYMQSDAQNPKHPVSNPIPRH